jgi:hypothetical protein
MSIVVRFPPSNVTKQQYDAVRNALQQSGDWPAEGCQLHVVFGDDLHWTDSAGVRVRGRRNVALGSHRAQADLPRT